jgi:hypothetical protein
MKNIAVTAIVATLVALLAPHTLSELGVQITRAGILIVRLGLLLDRPPPAEADADGYDSALPEPQHARASARRARPGLA